ncbi:hypothetical protein HGP05_08870 [Streptococcus sanguinis]|uniref:Uncharacterized protein n=1 Tax=Streptococcus sanguinis TaxID=1305 RepID=A0A7Y0VBI3_STRSA|nr:hypothetical protein [Streptococcus sanguinis]
MKTKQLFYPRYFWLSKVAATAALPLFAICQLEVALLPTMIYRPIQAVFQTST